MVQQEREKIVQLINRLAVARDKGKTLGRPKAELPSNFVKEYKKYKSTAYGDISTSSFDKMLGIGRSTLYKYIKLIEEI